MVSLQRWRPQAVLSFFLSLCSPSRMICRESRNTAPPIHKQTLRIISDSNTKKLTLIYHQQVTKTPSNELKCKRNKLPGARFAVLPALFTLRTLFKHLFYFEAKSYIYPAIPALIPRLALKYDEDIYSTVMQTKMHYRFLRPLND